ncbi:MAG: hypothetical protein HFG34_13005 [Eubacterium sp.]|nr:hypothetical protein [Eubacterium sp.]
MKVKNIQQAWLEACKLVDEDSLIKDYEATERAGYDIYRDYNEYYNYICILGDRLEVNLANGKSINIWIEQPENIKEYADCESATITIRTYENGNSRDTTRSSTPEEKKIIQGILTGALNAIEAGKDKQTVMDVAEYIGLNLLKKSGANTYDSIYNRIRFCTFIKD